MKRTLNRLNELDNYTIGSAYAKARGIGRLSQSSNIIKTKIDEINDKCAFEVKDVLSDNDIYSFKVGINMDDLCYIFVENLSSGGREPYAPYEISYCFLDDQTDANKKIYHIVRNLRAGQREKLKRMVDECDKLNRGIENMKQKLSENKLKKVIKECVEEELRKLYHK